MFFFIRNILLNIRIKTCARVSTWIVSFVKKRFELLIIICKSMTVITMREIDLQFASGSLIQFQPYAFLLSWFYNRTCTRSIRLPRYRARVPYRTTLTALIILSLVKMKTEWSMSETTIDKKTIIHGLRSRLYRRGNARSNTLSKCRPLKGPNVFFSIANARLAPLYCPNKSSTR